LEIRHAPKVGDGRSALELELSKAPPKQVAPFEPEELKKIEAQASKHPRHQAMVLFGTLV
jgi:hypothetical protein